MVNTAAGHHVARVLYKEIVEGDRRKAEAKSNDADSGGGARDFRFPYAGVLPAVEKIFPTKITKRGKTIHQGVFCWYEPSASTPTKKLSEFSSPTQSRPSEGWISQVPKFSCFDLDRMPNSGTGNRLLLLLIQRIDGSVWPHFAEETSIRSPGIWDQVVAEKLIKCMDAKRPINHAIIGHFDLTTSQSYCNGK